MSFLELMLLLTAAGASAGLAAAFFAALMNLIGNSQLAESRAVRVRAESHRDRRLAGRHAAQFLRRGERVTLTRGRAKLPAPRSAASPPW